MNGPLSLADLQSMADEATAGVKRMYAERLAAKERGCSSPEFTDQYGFFMGRDSMSDKCFVASVTGKAPTTLAGQIAVMLAYGRGERLLSRQKSTGNKLPWVPIEIPDWNWSSYEYCIDEPPQPAEYRPYEHGELVGLMGGRIKLIKDNDNTVYMITSVIGNEALIGRFYTSSEELLRNFVWMDGSPLGVLIDGEGEG
jgi:hypothetical protein